MLTICILLWKHCLVRRRRFINTILQLASVLLMIVLLYALNKVGLSTERKNLIFVMEVPESVLKTMPGAVPLRMLYAPRTNTTDALMDAAGPRLGLSRLDHLPSTVEILVENLKYQPTLKFIKEAPDNLYLAKKVMEVPESVLKTMPGAVPLRMLYAPRTNTTDALMDAAGPRLGLSRLDHLPSENEKGYAPFSSDEEMTRYRRNMHHSDAIVTFENMTDGLPSNLEYTIGMKMDFDPDQPLEEEDHYRADLSNAAFAQAQWAVDTSYLQMLTGAKINQTLNLVMKMTRVTMDPFAPYLMAVAAALCTMSHVAVFLSLVTALLAEKMTGIQELLKLVGVSVSTVIASHFLNALPAGLVYALGGAALLTNGAYAIVMRTPWALIAGALFLHHCAVVAVGIFLASIIYTRQHHASIVIVAFFGLFGVGLALSGIELIKDPSKTALGLIPPHGGLWLFMAKAGAEEKWGRPGSYFVVPFIFMALHTIVFLALGILFFYMFPGQYGTGMSLKSIIRKFKKGAPAAAAAPPPEPAREPEFFEPLPDRPVGIKIIKVSMAFPHHVALTNVSLDVLQGEITVLLGHNGAGKTTLMNIITGMLEPTSGDVEVNGLNARKNLSKVRKQLGMCPQHNLYYADLTVSEHYQIFAMLQGVSIGNSKKACNDLLKKLNLADKSKNLVGTLSGGMKRRVQLACALAGGASVLVLDEPSSGLDVETRRELWDTLLVLRGGRTVLLTTHFMEEADVLGDRIAALHMGRIRCCATPMFLKRAIGSGYRLTLSTAGELDEPALTALVHGPVPGAAVIDRMYKSVTYNLPAKDSAQLPALFAALEAARASLGITTMGVSQSTLDDVFLRLCTDINVEEFDTSKAQAPRKELKKLSCPIRCAWQFWALLKRQALYNWSKKVSFFLLQVLVPVACMSYLAVQLSSMPEGMMKISTERPAIGLDMYQDKPTTVIYVAEPDNYTPVMRSGYEGVDFANVEDFTEDMFNATDDVRIGIHIDDSRATAVYTDAAPLAAPAAVNVLTNTMAARLLGDPRAITTLVGNKYSTDDDYTKGVVSPKDSVAVYLFCVGVVSVALVQMSACVTLPSAEREAGTRHLLVMAGCPLALFWAATYAAHVGYCLLAVMLPIGILAPALDKDATFNYNFIGALFWLVLLALLASCALNNVIGMFRSQHRASNTTNIIVVIFGIFGALDRLILEDAAGGHIVYMLVEMSFVLVPPHAALAGAVQLARACLANAWCGRNLHLCPGLFVKAEIVNETECCNSTGSPQSYYSLDSKGAGAEMLFLFLQFVGYTAFLMILETQIMSSCFGTKGRTVKSRFTDPAVLAERQYVEENIKLDRKAITDAILVHDIYKIYMSKGVAFLAVKGLSFSVKKGECFGLLGVNGAGKSTTFKMLNAETRPTRGSIFSGGYFFKQRYSYMHTYSYCGQFQGMDAFLTGRQNLDLVLTMRGFHREDVAQEIVSWLDVLGLMKYADRRVSTYSGGCSRRLAAAAALCQQAPSTLLDEPTAGVDPVARRCVQAAVVRAKRAGDSVIIASHSMDEMEALCERMMIMSGGRAAALGSAPQLRAQYARGYSAVFKLFATKGEDRAKDTTTTTTTQMTSGIKEFLRPYLIADAGPSARDQEALDAEMHRRFDCNVTDDRKVMIQYHINNLMPYSQLFTQMEQIKGMFPNLIEDYSVTETTLEEVFLSIAKEAIEHRENLQQRKKVKKREPFFKKWCGKKQ